jgi:preprotein translocase subunit SecG
MELILGAVLIIVILLFVYVLLSSKSHDGQMVVTTTEEGKIICTLELDGDVADLMNRKAISFKVVKPMTLEEM